MAFRAIGSPNVEVDADGESRDQMEKQLQAIVTVLSLVNPLICGAMFAQIDAGQSRAIQLADTTRVALAVLVILVVAALIGARVLEVFGISLQAFSIAGGGVLSWIGFNMMLGRPPQPQLPIRDGAYERPSLAPLILFAASPGTITGVITLAVAHAKLLLPVTVLVAVTVGALGMWVVMMLLSRRGSRARGGLLHDTGTQFMGLIVLAMGVQFALTGFHDFLVAQR
jgi:multiple antibiotic resistance protein